MACYLLPRTKQMQTSLAYASTQPYRGAATRMVCACCDHFSPHNQRKGFQFASDDFTPLPVREWPPEQDWEPSVLLKFPPVKDWGPPVLFCEWC